MVFEPTAPFSRNKVKGDYMHSHLPRLDPGHVPVGHVVIKVIAADRRGATPGFLL